MTDSTSATAAECPRHAGEPEPCAHCALDADDDPTTTTATVPENIRTVWGDDAVLCTDQRHDSPAWHHRDYHDPPAPHSWRIRLILVRKSLARELRYIVRGR